MARGDLWFIVIVCGVINFAASGEGFVIDPRNEVACTAPEGTSGHCMIVQECKYALNIIKANGIRHPTVQEFLRKANCGFQGNNPMVCCPKDPDDEGNTDDRHIFDESGNKSKDSSKETGDDPNEEFQNPLQLLPATCGEDHGNRIIGGEMTEFDEFPWMAVLEYEYSRGTITGCGGVLITKRYVLTAAHCIRAIPSNWRLRNVRLGEYDTRTDPDCQDDGNGKVNCADRVLTIPIEREIVHESYMSPQIYRNDIALLRLDRNVEFSPYVQPICLPNSDAVSKLYWAAGWGQVEMKSSSDVKLKVSLPYFDFEQCAQTYATRKIILGEGQMCAGGKAGKDTCKGDSGGPLMKQVREVGKLNRWVVDGIVSFGQSPCAMPDWPAVYTKVYNYVPWILGKLRP